MWPAGIRVALLSGREYLPFAGDTLQCVKPAVVELEPWAGDRFRHRPRCQDFACTSKSCYPGTDMYGDATKVIPAYLALPRVNAGSGLQIKLTDTFTDQLCATDGSCRTLETGQETIAGLLDLAAPKVL